MTVFEDYVSFRSINLPILEKCFSNAPKSQLRFLIPIFHELFNES